MLNPTLKVYEDFARIPKNLLLEGFLSETERYDMMCDKKTEIMAVIFYEKKMCVCEMMMSLWFLKNEFKI